MLPRHNVNVRLPSANSGRNNSNLTTPLDFKKGNKQTLIPPSIYSNQSSHKSAGAFGNIRTPSDFTLKQKTAQVPTEKQEYVENQKVDFASMVKSNRNQNKVESCTKTDQEPVSTLSVLKHDSNFSSLKNNVTGEDSNIKKLKASVPVPKTINRLPPPGLAGNSEVCSANNTNESKKSRNPGIIGQPVNNSSQHDFTQLGHHSPRSFINPEKFETLLHPGVDVNSLHLRNTKDLNNPGNIGNPREPCITDELRNLCSPRQIDTSKFQTAGILREDLNQQNLEFTRSYGKMDNTENLEVSLANNLGNLGILSSRSDCSNNVNCGNQVNLSSIGHFNNMVPEMSTNLLDIYKDHIMPNDPRINNAGADFNHRPQENYAEVFSNNLDPFHQQESDNSLKHSPDYTSGDSRLQCLSYMELQDLYSNAKAKLTDLETKLSQLDKVQAEKKPTSIDGCESNLTKQLEEIQRQNQILSGKLKNIEQCQLSDVKNVVDRFLTQSQFENEKESLNTKIQKLEEKVAELEASKEGLLIDIDNKDERYEKAMVRNKEERYSYEECMDKLNVRISDMIDENERIRDEKEDLLLKYENSVKTMENMKKEVETKSRTVDDLNKKLSEELNKSTDLNDSLGKQRETFEAALKNVERMLKEEVAINANLDRQLREQDVHVKDLECKVTTMNQDFNYNGEMIKTLKNNLETQSKENSQLQQLCQTLKSSNESLNVHLTSMNEVLRMQEPYTGILSGEQTAKMLQMWREKVYSLLVLLKMKELKTKPEQYPDGDSSDF